MQVTQTLSDGLKREFKVVLPAAELKSRLDAELAELKDKVRINGFRPGKVPPAHLKKVYGRQVMADVVNNAVNEANRQIVDEHKLRLASEPKIDLDGDQAAVEKAMEAQGDLAFSVKVETLPAIAIGTFDDIALERPTFAVPDDEIDKAIERMAENNRAYDDKDGAAEKGDRVTVSFVGKIDGEPFEGGAGENIDVTLGSESFIPGFEDQLIGLKAGQDALVKVTFPESYSVPGLAGKPSEFDVKVIKVASPEALDVNEAFAKAYGFDDVEKLREAVRGNLQGMYDQASRDKVKRHLLDALDKRYDFPLPEGLVGVEFENIWNQMLEEQRRAGKTFADESTTEEAARDDYRKIAERRVRLGLLFAAIGESEDVKVSDDEVTKAIVERARNFPGQEKMVWDFYRKTPQAVAEIRAPLYEEKVVDSIIAKAKVTDVPVSKDDLFKIEDEVAVGKAEA